MYYDDQARRFNLLSGLLSGAVLGAGIALLLRPDPARPRTRGLRRAVGAAGDAFRVGRERFRL